MKLIFPHKKNKLQITRGFLKFIPKSRREIYRVLSNRYFPLFFWLRNSFRLMKSEKFIGRNKLWRRNYIARNLAARIRIFKMIMMIADNMGFIHDSEITGSDSGYCTRCGLCCEIASGCAEFPAEWPFPESWKLLFTNGCGNGQLFCAFLLEDSKMDGTRCAIYPYRPLACRKFEEDECVFMHRKAEAPMHKLKLLRLFN